MSARKAPGKEGKAMWQIKKLAFSEDIALQKDTGFNLEVNWKEINFNILKLELKLSSDKVYWSENNTSVFYHIFEERERKKLKQFTMF